MRQRFLALCSLLRLQKAVLPDNYLDKVFQRPMQLIVPAADLPELHDAEVKKEGLELRFQHIQHVVLVAGAVAERLVVIEFEPE